MKKIFLFSVIITLCTLLASCSAASPCDCGLTPCTCDIETHFSPDSRTMTSEEIMEKITWGTAKEDVISTIGLAQSQQTLDVSPAPYMSVTYPATCDVYETSDGRRIYIAYGIVGDGNMETVISIIPG